MLRGIFTVPILLSALGLAQEHRDRLRERALAAYEQNNPNGKPWSRNTRQSLQEQDSTFAGVFGAVKEAAERAFGVSVSEITGRELVQFDGDFIPPHIESASLSAIYWIDCDAASNPPDGDHNGALVLQSPVGPFGGKTLPCERRVQMVYPKPDTLLIFPSHLLHFGHVYNAQRPSVEIHFELEVA